MSSDLIGELFTGVVEGVLTPYVKEEGKNSAETGTLQGSNKNWLVTVVGGLEDTLIFVSTKILDLFIRFFSWLNDLNSKPIVTESPKTKPTEPQLPVEAALTQEQTTQPQPLEPKPVAVETEVKPIDPSRYRFLTKFSIFASGLRANAPGTKLELNEETGEFKLIFPTRGNEPLRAKIGKIPQANVNAIRMAEDAQMEIERELSGKIDLETGKVTLNGNGIIVKKHYWKEWTLNVKEFEITDEGFFFKDGWKTATFSVAEIADTMTDVKWENLEKPVVVKKQEPVHKTDVTSETASPYPTNPYCLQLQMFANALKMHADGSKFEINEETGDFKLTFPTISDEPLRATIGELKFNNAVKKAKDSKLIIDRELTGKIDINTGKVTLNGNGIIVKKFALFKEWTLTVKEFEMNDLVFNFKTEWGAASYNIHQIVGTMLDVNWENLQPVEKKKEQPKVVKPAEVVQQITWADETEDFTVLFPKPEPIQPSLRDRVTTFAEENSSTLIKIGSVVAIAAGHFFGVL